MKKNVDKMAFIMDTFIITRLHQKCIKKKELRMKRTLVLTAAAVLLAGSFGFA